MHDIDRTLSELELESNGYEQGEGLLELESNWGMDGTGEFEADVEGATDAGELESPLDEAEEMEAAADLLSVSDEAELEQFLGGLFRKIGRGFKSAFKPLGRILKPLAKKLLPIAGGAVGTFFGGPAGGALGSKLASTAGRAFGLELEGLSPEDQEMEVARRFVRLAATAAKHAAQAPPSAPPTAVARAAVAAAARRHAPGLVRGQGVSVMSPYAQHSGRWIRRGRRIILLGV